MTPGRARALTRHLRDHHQVVDRATLVALGFPHDHGTRQVAIAKWQQLHPGIYCAYTGPATFATRCAAALAACGPEASLDDATAAILHGGHGFDDSVIYVVVPHGAHRPRLRGVRVRQSSTLTERSFLQRNGLRVVRREWAVLAAARRLPRQARGILAAAAQTGFVRADDVFACVLLVGRFRGRPAIITALRDVLGGSRSELELLLLDVLRTAGLPMPKLNWPLRLGGRRAWLDACYPELRIAIEIDGRAYHLLSEDWESDLARQNDIVLDGWLILRFSARVLRDHPDTVVQQVQAALASRRAA